MILAKFRFNVRISGHLKTLRLKRRCKLVENLRTAGHFLNKSVESLSVHRVFKLRIWSTAYVLTCEQILWLYLEIPYRFLAPYLRASKSVSVSVFSFSLFSMQQWNQRQYINSTVLHRGCTNRAKLDKMDTQMIMDGTSQYHHHLIITQF